MNYIKIKFSLPPNIEIELSYQNELFKLDIPVYRGIITKVNHTNTKVESISFESGDNIQVDTLLWIPPVKPSPLIQRLVENMGLEVDEQGYVKTDEKQQTNVRGLFVAGDIQGSKVALVAANYDGIAATSIAHEGYD
jgi:pyruvate/2-oxoglutarate dehydrogenase complex dihydrolipoamide dehydrogenase (E3) component